MTFKADESPWVSAKAKESVKHPEYGWPRLQNRGEVSQRDSQVLKKAPTGWRALRPGGGQVVRPTPARLLPTQFQGDQENRLLLCLHNSDERCPLEYLNSKLDKQGPHICTHRNPSTLPTPSSRNLTLSFPHTASGNFCDSNRRA